MEANLIVELAITDRAIEESLRLRHKVFVEEMGAQTDCPLAGIEKDRFDDYCHHLLVRDTTTNEVVASTRILTDTQARLTGGYYSEGEFDLGNVKHLSGRTMEVGRTCVHPNYRNGGTIAVLWTGLARFMDLNRFSYLIGCASIPMNDNGIQAKAIMNKLRGKYLSADDQRVAPKLALPGSASVDNVEARMPPLLKAYMRLGAKICGEPCWDPQFNCADVFIMLDVDNLQGRYARHFFRPTTMNRTAAVAMKA